MSQSWDLETPVVSNNDIKLARVVHKIFGDKFPHINENVTKAMSLYTYLAKHLGEPVGKLATEIRTKGKPIFTEKDIREIQAVLQKHKQNYAPFFQRMAGEQEGGGPVTVPAPAPATGAKPITSAPPTPQASALDADPSRSKFFDKMIRKIMHPISSRIPPSWDGVLWYTFLVYNLEQMEYIGPFISTALDTITLSLPVMAELAASGFEKLISLAPVPYASFAGEIVGYIASLIFIVFAVFLNITRKHFGSAFKVSLEAIPMFGDMLMDAAQSVETGAERYVQNRNKLLRPVRKISPTLYDNLDYYVPDTSIHPTAPQPLNYDTVKADVAGYVLEETGIADTIAEATAKIPDLTKIGANQDVENKGNAEKPNTSNVAPGANKGKTNVAPGANKGKPGENQKNSTQTNKVTRTTARRIKGGGRRYTRRR